MKGYIKLAAVEGGISGEVRLSEVDLVDKAILFHAFVESLELDKTDIYAMLAIYDLINDKAEKITIDGGAIERLMNRGEDKC